MNRSHLFFDLDGTLAEPGGVIPSPLVRKLIEIEDFSDIVVVSGATYYKALKQLNGFSPVFLLSQSGNVWNEGLDEIYRAPLQLNDEIWNHINQLMRHFGQGHVQNRGAQISLSIIGHDADPAAKQAFDPDRSKRKAALRLYPFSSKYHVVIGGTTTFDYTSATKGENLLKFTEAMGWDLNQCTYFGDSLEEEGNDYSVVFVMKTIAVTSPADTLSKL